MMMPLLKDVPGAKFDFDIKKLSTQLLENTLNLMAKETIKSLSNRRYISLPILSEIDRIN